MNLKYIEGPLGKFGLIQLHFPIRSLLKGPRSQQQSEILITSLPELDPYHGAELFVAGLDFLFS